MAENTFDRFSVFFTGDTVFLDGTVFPLGRLTTDVLNLDSEVLTEIDQRVNHLLLRQLNNRIQSSLYFAKEGWSKYAFT